MAMRLLSTPESWIGNCSSAFALLLINEWHVLTRIQADMRHLTVALVQV